MNETKPTPHPMALPAAALICAGLLYMQNGFFGLIRAKLMWTLFAAAFCAAAMLVFLAVPRLRSSLCRPDACCAAAAAFGGIYLLSALANPQLGQVRWMGAAGRSNGAVLYLALAVLYLCLRAWGRGLRAAALPVLQGVGFVCALLTVLNFCSRDILGIFAQLDEEYDRLMTSTLGNVNFAAVVYLLVLVPTLQQAFAGLQSRPARVWNAAVWAVGTTAVVCCGSDGVFLAMAVAAVFLLAQPGCGWQRPAVLLRLCACTAAVCLPIGIYLPLQNSNHLRADTGRDLTRLLLHWPVTLALLALCLLGAWGLGLLARRDPDRSLSETVRQGGWLAFSAAALLAAAAQVIPEFLPALRFGPAFSGYRGVLWSVTPQLLGSFPPLQLLVGAGPDAVDSLLNPRFSLLFAQTAGLRFDSMHNEYLQYLLCVGVLGLLCWLAVLWLHLRAAARSRDPLAVGYAAAVLAYAVQAFFNIAMPVTTPLLFLLLACCPDAAAPPAEEPAPAAAKK